MKIKKLAIASMVFGLCASNAFAGAEEVLRAAANGSAKNIYALGKAVKSNNIACSSDIEVDNVTLQQTVIATGGSTVLSRVISSSCRMDIELKDSTFITKVVATGESYVDVGLL